MSQQKLLHTIASELKQINEDIDIRVIKGLTYKREARRHRLLLNMLQDVQSKPNEPLRPNSFLSLLF
jgi:hypothetical protein